MKFDILNRCTGKVQFTAEIDCATDASREIKIGLAVKWGINAGANLARALKIQDEEIPSIPKIDAVIMAEIEKGGTLDMTCWHGPKGWCGTTHCRAGWAVHCAGKAGKALEDKVGTRTAATLIYQKSRPGQYVPRFFAADEEAMADLRKCAAEQEAST